MLVASGSSAIVSGRAVWSPTLMNSANLALFMSATVLSTNASVVSEQVSAALTLRDATTVCWTP